MNLKPVFFVKIGNVENWDNSEKLFPIRLVRPDRKRASLRFRRRGWHSSKILSSLLGLMRDRRNTKGYWARKNNLRRGNETI